jgi:hypothetical protein
MPAPSTPRWPLGPALAAALLGALPACGGAAPTPEAGRSPAAAPAATAAADDTAARAAWDAALKLRFAGDTLGADAALVQLAARHPDTRYGRAAAQQGVGGMVGVAGVGILAAVAVPAFVKYTRKAKGAEATALLRQGRDAVVAWGEKECARLGKRCATQFAFPTTVGLTPAQPACDGGRPAAQPVDPKAWDHPTWKALGVRPAAPTLWQYEFTADGKGTGASFVLRAVADLDCDGETGSYEMSGFIDESGKVVASDFPMENNALE